MCMTELPLTDHFVMLPNRFERHFIGRVNINFGAALLEFYKFGITQALVHRLKYEGRAEIGEKLGRMAGNRMNNHSWTSHIDYIVPVPLHWRKMRKRGYNQAEKFAKGIQEVTGLPILNHILTKPVDNTSQTNKSRVHRMANVESTYEMNQSMNLAGRHVLIVDDIITTGATLEACANAIAKKEPKVKISMLTIGIANEW